MSREGEWRGEWEDLRAERALARRRWRGAVDGLSAKARDPLGLGGFVRDHPVAAAGIGAAAAALLVFLLRRSRRDGESRGDGPPRDAPGWPAVLRDAALGLAVPWILRVLKERTGRDFDPDAATGPDRPRPAEAPREPLR